MFVAEKTRKRDAREVQFSSSTRITEPNTTIMSDVKVVLFLSRQSSVIHRLRAEESGPSRAAVKG